MKNALHPTTLFSSRYRLVQDGAGGNHKQVELNAAWAPDERAIGPLTDVIMALMPAERDLGRRK